MPSYACAGPCTNTSSWGVNTNIVLHKAIMENPRFVSGDLDTDFINREVSLLADMQRIKERDKALAERLSTIFRKQATMAGTEPRR